MTQRVLSVLIWLLAALLASFAWAFALDVSFIKVYLVLIALRISINLLVIGIIDLAKGSAGGSRNL